ncbi:cytochrome P450 736A117-like [Silene latifolia]|uniref:cytochrome P450 736A117-like n=1 Tax=Silene latifolia TaxID=37657 RepID=UPI003D770AEB
MATVFDQLLQKFAFHPIALLSFLSFLIILYPWLSTKNRLPSPRKLPIIGNLHQLGTLPHRSLRKLSDKYGDLMLLHLGSKPTLVVSSPKAAAAILKTHDIVFTDRPISQVALILFYDCIELAFGKYGEYWRQVRNLCMMHMLGSKKVRTLRRIREEEVSLMVENIRKSTLMNPGVSVNLRDYFTTLINDLVSRSAFGRKYEAEEGCGNLKELLTDFVGVLGSFSVGTYVPWLSWIDHMRGVFRKATAIAKAFDVFLDKIVQEHIDRRLNSQSQTDDEAFEGDKDRDLVDILLDYHKTYPSFGRVNVKALLLDILVAGVETTVTLLEWTMSELIMHPEIMKRLQDEVRGFVKDTTFIDEADLQNMPYLKSVIKEALRLHPSAPLLLPRESSQDVKVYNYDIAAGTEVIINAWAIQRLPSLWDQPEEFRPERFLNSTIDVKGNDFEYIPFGAGRKACPGLSFGIANAELALANLVGLFEWKVPDELQGDSFMDENFGSTVSRRYPLTAIPTPYSSN